MNILASYNWLKEFLKTDLPPEEFAKRMTAAGNSVERIHDLSERYKNVVIGDVLEINEHPNANKLRLAKTKIGKETVDIVCGGTNLAVGQKVPVALPGASVRWHGEEGWTQLHETEIRGVKSHGMICAAVELGFDKVKQGEREIWDLSSITNAKAGTPFADALGLDDVIFDIEVTTNRPDCMSIVGQAREGSAVTGAKLTWIPKLHVILRPKAEGSSRRSFAGAQDDRFSVSVQDPKLCPRYQAIVIDGVKVGPSPWWLQARLLLAGHRPINNVVDVTNYVLHELGQPLHAFDADKLDGGQIIVRRGHKGESIRALDEKEYPLTDTTLVIADTKKPVAIAGVMGGAETGTTEATTRVVIEAAAFEPVNVRRTSRSLSLASDSSRLFEKGLSTEATEAALARAVELLTEVAGGRVASEVVDVRAETYEHAHFPFDPKRAVALIGADIPEKKMVDTLKRLGFGVAKGTTTGAEETKGTRGAKVYDVEVPYWRDHDIEASVDFVEEIARIFGYANVPSVLPDGALALASEDPKLVWERCAKEALRAAGATEGYAYSFVSAAQLERYGVNSIAAVRIQNPLSSDQEFLRTTLVPTMLTLIEANQRGFPEELLFEIAPVYAPVAGDIPKQTLRLLIAATAQDGERAFLRAKGTLQRVLADLGVRRVRFERLTDSAKWHPGRSATVSVGDHVDVGVLGEVSRDIANAFGLEGRVVVADIDFELALPHFTTSKAYVPIPLYPAIKRDLAFLVPLRTEYEAIEHKLKATNPLLQEVELFDVYQGKGVPEGQKSLAVHLTLRADDRTLESGEADQLVADLRRVLEDLFSATIRG
jgi:phenylalanyl-tRNA synthetase beta chain